MFQHLYAFFFSHEQEVNTVDAIWMKSPSEVDDAQYNEFYKFIAKAYDEPLAKVSLLVVATNERSRGLHDVCALVWSVEAFVFDRFDRFFCIHPFSPVFLSSPAIPQC